MKNLLVMMLAIGLFITEESYGHSSTVEGFASNKKPLPLVEGHSGWTPFEVKVTSMDAIDHAAYKCGSHLCAYNSSNRDLRHYATGYGTQVLEIEVYLKILDASRLTKTGEYKESFRASAPLFTEDKEQFVRWSAFDMALKACEKKSDFCVLMDVSSNTEYFNNGILEAHMSFVGYNKK